MSAFIISLDFELFWGVTDSKTIENYGKNILGEWQVVPAILELFKQYGIHATWSTVGMVMCKDFKEWSSLRPSIMPTYNRQSCSTYSFSALVRDYPKLFFAPTLVEQILCTEGQELGCHTYSHFYCSEKETTVEQFIADLDTAKRIFDENKVKPSSLTFPRNQIQNEYLNVLMDAGFTAYRGNQNHWIYKNGRLVSIPFANGWRLIQAADDYLPITGHHIFSVSNNILCDKPMNIPASRFFRPISGYLIYDLMHLGRVMDGMLEAARLNSNFHLWWHPHNFGRNIEANLMNLEKILKYYQRLNDKYNLQSMSMKEVERLCRIK